MRLSYYGGGHYDSLVNDSDEFDPLADPGSREALALQKARARKTNADASSALAVSDAEATERAAVEQALSASRAARRPSFRPSSARRSPASRILSVFRVARDVDRSSSLPYSANGFNLKRTTSHRTGLRGIFPVKKKTDMQARRSARPRIHNSAASRGSRPETTAFAAVLSDTRRRNSE